LRKVPVSIRRQLTVSWYSKPVVGAPTNLPINQNKKGKSFLAFPLNY